ncbi:MAG: ATP-binding protein [Nitriliruptoraceae bacterium]
MAATEGWGWTTPPAIAELSAELLVVLDAQGRLVALQGSRRPEVAALREAIESRPWREIVHPEDLPAVGAGLRELLEGGSFDALSFRVLLPNGGERWIEGRARGDPDQALVFVLLRDVSAERRRVEIEDRLARMGAVGTWEIDLPGGQVRWSLQLRRLYGLRPHEPPLEVDASLACYLPPRQQELAAAVQRLLDDGEPFDLELGFQPPRGPLRWVRCTGEAVVEDGHAVMILGTVQDLTVSHAEQLRLARIEQLAHLTDNGLLELDRAGRVLFANLRARELLRVPAGAEVTGHPLVELLPDGAETPRWHRFLEVAGTATSRARLTISADRIVQAALRPLDPSGRDGAAYEPDDELVDGGHEPTLLVALSDITELVHAERARDAFLAAVSHELRNPLAAVTGAIATLERGVAGPLPQAAELLIEVAGRSATRLQHLVEDLLDTQRVLAGRVRLDLADHDLGELVEQVVAELQHLAVRADRALVLTAPPQPLTARVDDVRVQQVVTNLVTNALRYAPPGTPVRIDLTSDASYHRVRVRDSGPGVPASFADRIFQPFRQADPSDDRSDGGTGLGLAISRDLVERMGGRIGYDSQPGRTEFWFELPAVARAPEGPANGAG